MLPLWSLWGLSLVLLLFELPIQAMTVIGVVRSYLRARAPRPPAAPHLPSVSCLITCYAEGKLVQQTIYTLVEQCYDAPVEIITMVDGASRNRDTLAALQAMQSYVDAAPRRSLRIVPKWERGGRVSSLNSGLALATGEIVMALDGDTCFDNDMIFNAVQRMADPCVVAVAGNLRVSNKNKNLLTRLQALEYMLTISLSKTGLSEWNALNNISGAFGVFRREMLTTMGGWNTGTAEDLDMTIRHAQYFGRHPLMRMRFAHDAIGHTEVPETIGRFVRQRMVWDGDCHYEYMRAHRAAFNPRLLGARFFLMMLWAGLIGQVVLPFWVFLNVTYLALAHPSTLLAAFPLTYAYYMVVMSLQFVLYLGMVSERPRQDAPYGLLLPLYPFFSTAKSFITIAALLKNALLRSFLDSPMAPYWVLMRSKW